MSLFSQSLCFGENTLQELEKGAAALNPVIVTTPNRSYAVNNSDSDIIEESPTNFSTVFSLRERTKPKTRKKKSQRITCEQIKISKPEITSNTISQFMQSKYDFSDDILNDLPETDADVNDGKNCESANVPECPSTRVEDLPCEPDMFDDSINANVSPTKSSTKIIINERESSVNIAWGDSLDFNNVDLDLNLFETNKENNAMELNLKVDEQIALGIDNVTFTQNCMNEASFENDLDLKSGPNTVATSKFIEEEMQSCKQSFHEYINECKQLSIISSNQLSVSNLNMSQSSFVLNYSQSTEELEQVIPTQKSYSQPLQQLNSISSWGKSIYFLINLNFSQLIAYHGFCRVCTYV